MRTHSNRIRQGLRIEWLEERNAPSRGASLASALETLHHHATGREHAGRVHEVRALRHGHGKDDGANHNVNDHRGGHGKDDPANHDLNDNKGVTLTTGKDDPANHDQNDNKGATTMSHDDPASHDVNDQHGGHGHDDKGGHH